MVREETPEEDDRLRDELRHIDAEKLKQAIKPLVSGNLRPRTSNRSRQKRRRNKA